MSTKNNLKIYFMSETGKGESIILNNVREDLTLSETQDLADAIIAKNSFFTNSGDLKTFQYAEVLTQTVRTLD